jgi:hypothetical protein
MPWHWPWGRSKHHKAEGVPRTPPVSDIWSPEHLRAQKAQADPSALHAIANTAGSVTATSTSHDGMRTRAARPSFTAMQTKETSASDHPRPSHTSISKKHEASSRQGAQEARINSPPHQADKFTSDIGRVRRISSPKIIGATSKHKPQESRSSHLADITSNKLLVFQTATQKLEAALPTPNDPHPTPSHLNGTRHGDSRAYYMSLPTAWVRTGFWKGQSDKVAPNNPRSRHISLFDIQKKTSKQNAALSSFATERLNDPSSGHSRVHHMSLSKGRVAQSTPEDQSSLVAIPPSADPRDNSSARNTSSSAHGALAALPGQYTHSPFPQLERRGPIERIRNRFLSIGRRAPVSTA